MWWLNQFRLSGVDSDTQDRTLNPPFISQCNSDLSHLFPIPFPALTSLG